MEENLNYQKTENYVLNSAEEPSDALLYKDIIKGMYETYLRKNHDYGNSFSKSIEKYGPIAGLTRISDKFNRLETLILNKEGAMVTDESTSDTLIDLASYCILLKIEFDKNADK